MSDANGTAALVVVVFLVIAGTVLAVPGAVAAGQTPADTPTRTPTGPARPGSNGTVGPVENASGDAGGLPSALAPVVEAAGTDAATQPEVYETAARAGAEDALASLAARGIEVDADTRAAAIQGAVTGAALIEQSAGDTRPTTVTVRAAANGAVSGTLVRGSGASVSSDTIRGAVSGSLAGAALSTALGVGQGGTDARLQVFGAAYGGAEGTVATTTALSADRRAVLTPDHVRFAALGGAGGAAGAASLLPIFGDAVDARRTRAAAFGAAAGTLQGTAERLGETGRVEPGQTLAAALGASAGTLSATLQEAGLTENRLSGTAYGVGRETVRRADELTTGQMLETAVTTAVDRLAGDATGDPVFPSAIVLPSYNVAIGPPRDIDADGKYEDVNGNRLLSYADVVSLSVVRSLSAEGVLSLTADQRRGLDFNGDGVFDWRDVRALDEEVTAATGDSP